MPKSDRWQTPIDLVDDIREFFGGTIDLDPTSEPSAQKHIRAERFWTKEDDALSKDFWVAESVFMNPPYSRSAGTAGPFVEKIIEQWEREFVGQAIVLLNVATANKWWQPLWKFPICFVSPRLRFRRPDGTRGDSPFHDNALVYLPGSHIARDAHRFANFFDDWGTTVQKVQGWRA